MALKGEGSVAFTIREMLKSEGAFEEKTKF